MMRSGKFFQAQIDDLVSEVAFALQWQGPAILLVLYRSSHVRDDGETSLSAALKPLGQELAQIRVRDGASDPLALIENAHRSDCVFSVSDLDRGGGTEGADAYRALNLHRETFIEANLRCVFWLTETEAQRMSLYAPDFWAFRHRVFDLVGERATPERSASFCGLTWIEWPWPVFERELASALAYREKMLAVLPHTTETVGMRATAYAEIAGLHIRAGAWPQALEAITRGLGLVSPLKADQQKSRLLSAQAVILFNLNRYEEAHTALQEANRLTPANGSVLTLLAQAGRLSGRRTEGLGCAQKAIRITPHYAAAWNEYGNILADLGRDAQALDAYDRACALAPENVIPPLNKGAVLASSNRLQEALTVLRALQTNPKLDLGQLAERPGFDFARKL